MLVRDAFVPEHRTHRIVDVAERTEPGMVLNDRPLYRLPWLSVFWYGIGAAAIGAARGRLEALIDITRERIAPSTGLPAAENPFLMVRLAEAVSTVSLHHDRMACNWREQYVAVHDAPRVPDLLGRRCRYDSAFAVQQCLRALGHVFELAGGGVIQRRHPLQRYYRDVLAMVNHPTANLEGMAMPFAKSLLGLPSSPFDRRVMGSLLEHG